MANIFSVNNQIPESPKIPPTSKGGASSYVDPTGELTSKDLSLGLWWVKHKVLLYRLLVGGLIALSAAFWVFSIPYWMVFILETPNVNLLERQASQFNNYNAIIQRFNPKPLQVVSTNLFQDGVNKLDAVSEVINPNKDYIATFDYTFQISGTSTPPGQAVVLANSRTLVASLGFADVGGAGGAVLQIKNLRWQRISAHDIPDAESWQASRINFTVSSTTYEGSMSTPDLKANRLVFVLRNESAYGFKRPQFYVGLYTGGSLIGVMSLQTEDFRSLESKEIDLRNFTSNLAVQTIEIFPLINVYDEEVYLPPER